MLSLPIKGGLHLLPVTLKDTSLLVLLTESLWPFTNASRPPTCMCFSLHGTSRTCWDFIYTLYYSYRGLKVWHQQETTEIIAADINTTGLSVSRPRSNKSNRNTHFEMLIMSFRWGFCEVLRNICASVFRFYVTWTRSEPITDAERRQTTGGNRHGVRRSLHSCDKLLPFPVWTSLFYILGYRTASPPCVARSHRHLFIILAIFSGRNDEESLWFLRQIFGFYIDGGIKLEWSEDTSFFFLFLLFYDS